ncbi:MAG: hypothetical protein LIO75_05390 [Lachnospiraceae bacterium]|nr:hypothetical protein [Lachnospiraceae bacterium]
MEKTELLTAAQLIRRTEIEEGQYSTAVLEQFIEDYEITEDNVGTLNISLLLEEYADICGIKDVSGLLNASAETRASDYTEDVAAIAFYENVGTGSECVYYDVAEGCRYRATDLYLFSDLNQTEAEENTGGAQLAVRLEELGVFSWENVSDTEGLADPQRMVLAVAYGDGTVFRITAEGILSEVLPENYAQVREVLLR